MKIYKREGKKGTSWQIYFYEPSKEPGGKVKLVGKTFSSRKDASDYLSKVRVAKKEKRYHDVFDVKREYLTLFSELADHYIENFKSQKSYPTKQYMIKRLRAKFGQKKLSEITRLDLETYRTERRDAPLKSGQSRAEASVNYELATLSHMMQKAVDWEMLETSPFRKGKRLMFKVDNARGRYLSAPEIESLMKAIDDLKIHAPHLKAIVSTALLTGMRKGELLGLKWGNIVGDFINLKGDKTKSGKGRQIPINARLAEVLWEVRQKNQLRSEYVFCDSQGRRFHDVRSSFANALRRAGIDDFTFHDLRHTYASHFMMREGNLTTLSKLLGHASLAMTMRYSHFSKGHLLEAVADFDILPDAKKSIKNSAKNEKEASAPSLTS